MGDVWSAAWGLSGAGMWPYMARMGLVWGSDGAWATPTPDPSTLNPTSHESLESWPPRRIRALTPAAVAGRKAARREARPVHKVCGLALGVVAPARPSGGGSGGSTLYKAPRDRPWGGERPRWAPGSGAKSAARVVRGVSLRGGHWCYTGRRMARHTRHNGTVLVLPRSCTGTPLGLRWYCTGPLLRYW